MRPKKTIIVSAIVENANEMLKNPLLNKSEKEGVICLLEKILNETGNYNGFMFIDNEDCEINTLGHVSRKYFYNFK